MSKKSDFQTEPSKIEKPQGQIHKQKMRLLTWLGIVLPSSVAVALGIVE